MGGLEGHGPPSASLFEQGRGVGVGWEGENPLRLAFRAREGDVGGLEEDGPFRLAFQATGRGGGGLKGHSPGLVF